jgi:serine O-acetyltransferase
LSEVHQVIRRFRHNVGRHRGQLREWGIWAVAVCRLGSYAQKLPPGPLQQTVRAAQRSLSLAFRLATRTSLATNIKVGNGLVFVHALNVTIGPGVVLGDRVEVMQDVTIAASYESTQAPKIGNDVFIGAGATILGAVSVGDGAAIGANSLVVSDVPAGAFVIGVPAKTIRWGAWARGKVGASGEVHAPASASPA